MAEYFGFSTGDGVNEDHKRERDLIHELEACPETEIVGLVDSGGLREHRLDWSLTSSLIIPYIAWRQTGAIASKIKLLVWQPGLNPEQLQEMLKLLKPFDTPRLKVKMAPTPTNGVIHSLLLELLDLHTIDPELKQIANELLTPQVFKDRQLGKFVLDRDLNWYEGSSNWCGAKIALILEVDKTNQPETAASLAHTFWQDQPGWHTRVLDCAANQLLETANEWLEGNEPPLSADDFKARMILESITVCPDGRFEFWFDDGDLFWGHSIEVRGTLDDGPTDASIHG